MLTTEEPGDGSVVRPSAVPAARTRYLTLGVLAIAVLLLDQATKAAIREALPLGTYFFGTAAPEPQPVIGETFFLVHIGNPGAAWGMFSGMGDLLSILGIAVILWIFAYRKSLGLGEPIMQVTFGFLIGGILGNVIDRLRQGYVTDFLDFHIPAIHALGFEGYRWPAFNIADAAIFSGVALYLLLSLRKPVAEETEGKDS